MLLWPPTAPTWGDVRLRAFEERDVPMVRDLSTDPYVPATGTLPGHASEAEAVAWIERQHERLRTGTGYSFCVADRDDDRALGQVGLGLAALGDGQASAGYGVAPRERGRGVAARALAAVTAVAWGVPGLHRVVLDVEPWNVASVRTAERAGYRCEGLAPEQREIGGRRVDVLRFSVARDPSSDEVRQGYAQAAGPYTALFGSVDRVHADDLAFVRAHLGDVAGPVLDLGCGPGHLTGFLHDLGRDVTGIDLVPEMVAHARAARPDVPFEVGSLTSLDRAPASVAGALVWYSLIHLDAPALDDALAGIRRAMAPGGRLVVGFFDGDAHEPFDHQVVTAYRWPVGELAARLERAGFVEVGRVRRTTDGERPHAALAAVASAPPVALGARAADGAPTVGR